MGNLPTKICSLKSRSNSQSTTSSQQSIKDSNWYRYEQGRRFHNFESEEAKYCLPNDLPEQDRLQLQHYLMRFAWKGNYSSPVREMLERSSTSPDDVYRVLDVGCGPATWVLEMATDYPNAHFYGVDMSLIFPSEIHPGNVEFLQHNVLNGLPWPDEYFDFVYQRFMVMSYTVEQWNFVLKELLRVTKKGGWLELFEACTDPLLAQKSTYTNKILNALNQTSRTRDINPYIVMQLPVMLESQNQVEQIFVERIDIPIGPWGGRVGELTSDNMVQVFEAAKIPVTKYLQITNEEYDTIREMAISEFKSKKLSGCTGRIYGKKKLL